METANLDIQEIKLGKTVRDPVLNIQGYATSRHEIIGGNVQWGIQQPTPDGSSTVPELIYNDWHLLDVVDDGISARVPPTADTDTIQLGDKVKEEVTGFIGIATERIIHINGCIRYFVCPKAKKANEYPDGLTIDHIRLTKIGVGIKPKPKAKPKKVTKKPPGGPIRRGSEIRSAR